jgi:protein-tyrosine phosphatase
VYVHCKIGYSRSAAAIGAWLLDAGLAATPEAAIALVREARPTLVVRREAWAALQEYSTLARMVRRPPAARLVEVRT